MRYLSQYEIDEIKKCKDDIVYFITTYCRLRTASGEVISWKPHPYQLKLWEKLSGNRNVIVNKSRQLGCSWATVAFALWRTIFTPNTEILFLSQTEKKAIRLLEILKFLVSVLPDFLVPEIVQNNQTRIVFSFKKVLNSRAVEYKSSVDSLTSSPRTAASYTPTFVIIDEAAHIPYSDETFAALKPALAQGGTLAVVSTPNGTKNFFYRLWVESQTAVLSGREPAFFPIVAHWRDCGYDDAWYEKATGGMTKVQILQEFELQFITSGTPFFDLDRLEASYRPPDKYKEIYDNEGRNLLVQTDVCYTGVDTASGGNDYTSLVTLNSYGVEIASLHRNDIPIEEFVGFFTVDQNGRTRYNGILQDWIKRYPGAMVVEYFGTGEYAYHRVADSLTPDDTSYVVPIRPNAHIKQRILNNLRMGVYSGQVIITDPFTYECMRVFEDQGDGRAGAPPGFHDDPVIALALAYNELCKNTNMFIDLDFEKKKPELPELQNEVDAFSFIRPEFDAGSDLMVDTIDAVPELEI